MSDIQDEAYSEAMAKIERLKTLVIKHSSEAAELAFWKDDAKKLISELADALAARIDWTKEPLRGDLIKRAREAAK